MTLPSEDQVFSYERVRAYALALLIAYAVGFAALIVSRTWPINANGAATCIDFVWLWAAGQMAILGKGLAAYDYTAFSAVQAPLIAVSKGPFPYYHWLYPPHFLLAVMPLGLVSYVVGLALWVGATLCLYLYAISRIIPHRPVLVLALIPFSVPLNVYSGHTSFLLAAFLGLALFYLKRRPYLAGIFLGLLTYKPLFGPLFPVVLLITGQWRVIAGAVVAIGVLVVTASAVFGVGVWSAYLHSLNGLNVQNFMPDKYLDPIIQTVFGLMYWMGASLQVKWFAHATVAVAMAIIVCVIWRRPGSDDLKAAALAIGALTAAPYMLAYDLVTLTIPMAFLVQDGLTAGFLRGERFLLLACVVAIFASVSMPIGPFILVALMFAVLRRLRSSAATSSELGRLGPGALLDNGE